MEVMLWALLIFFLRVTAIAVGTLTTLFVVRGERLLASITGFFHTLLFVVAIGKVVQDLTNIPNVLAYCAGFSVGTWVGMMMERRLALGYMRVHIVSSQKAKGIASSLRKQGYGVTEETGRGKEGRVGIVEVVARRKDVPSLSAVVTGVDEEAFISMEEATGIHRGFIPGVR